MTHRFLEGPFTMGMSKTWVKCREISVSMCREQRRKAQRVVMQFWHVTVD